MVLLIKMKYILLILIEHTHSIPVWLISPSLCCLVFTSFISHILLFISFIFNSSIGNIPFLLHNERFSFLYQAKINFSPFYSSSLFSILHNNNFEGSFLISRKFWQKILFGKNFLMPKISFLSYYIFYILIVFCLMKDETIRLDNKNSSMTERWVWKLVVMTLR